MPLIQSKCKKAFSSNVKKEMDEDKSQPQSLAIAYSVQRKNKKKMADGGQVPANAPAPDLHEAADQAMKDVTGGIDARMKAKQAIGKPGYAKGGMIDDDVASSIADHIIQKRQKMAEGGEVDLDANSEETGRSPYDEYNAEAGNEEQYDDGQISPQPEDSNEHADMLDDADAHSMVDKIRAKLRAKRS